MLVRFTKKGEVLGLGIRVPNIIGVMITGADLEPKRITHESLIDLKPTAIKGVFTDNCGNYLIETHPKLIRTSPKDKRVAKENIKLGDNGQVSEIGGIEFRYRSDETLYTIGRTDFDTFSSFNCFKGVIRYRRVGHFSLDYGVDASVKTIGDYLYGVTSFRYYSDGRIKKVGNISITYDDKGEAKFEEIEVEK